jgi:hypothetical protein
MIIALQDNLSLKTILPIYAVATMCYGFFRGYTYVTRTVHKGNDLPNPSSLSQNFINGLTLGISSLVLMPFNLKHILTRKSGDSDIL